MVKALIRDSEIIIEPFSKWVEDHIEWMTTPRPEGDGYQLIEVEALPEEPDH